MSSDSDRDTGPVQVQAGEVGKYAVDARGGMGVLVGDRSTQINYIYYNGTWTDGVAQPPLVSGSGAVDSPYRGLGAFEEQDAAFFFGREAAATHLLEKMSRHLQGAGLLVVSGVSGAGKSSLLKAGVLPRIRRAGLESAPGSASWPCLVFTPTRAPLDELALRVAMLARTDAAALWRGLDADPGGFALTARQAALAPLPGPGGDAASPAAEHHQPPYQQRLLLVVDQFEQLFTQCPDEKQRRAFITALHAAATVRHGPDNAPAALVVLGVRADFEARCADYPQLADAVQDRYLVTSMTGRQLRMAITEPAKRAGSQVDDDLVDVLLGEVRARQPGVSGAGVLPLLSHALDQAWRSRTRETLTLADYERTGGIEGAVADSAQRAYNGLTSAQQTAARHVFTRLTATSSDDVDTADRATRAELLAGKSTAQGQDVEAALEAFAAERLLTLSTDSVEISHEVLLTAWPLLRDRWLAETHADRIVRTRLRNVAAEWARHSRDPSYLYDGSLLQTARETKARIAADPARHPPLSQTEDDFLQASDHARRRHVRRLRALGAVLTVLLIGFLSAAVWGVRASQQAAYQRNLRKISVSEQLIGQSQILRTSNPAVSKLLSIAAWDIKPSAVARYAMLLAAGRPQPTVLSSHVGSIYSVAFSPDGKTLATGSADGSVRLWNLATHRQAGAFTPQAGAVYLVAFSPDGKTVATGSAHSTRSAHSTWQILPDGTVRRVPAGRVIGHYSTVRLWNLAAGQQAGGLLIGHVGRISSMAFSPDGKTLTAGTADGSVVLWNLATRRQAGSVIPQVGPVSLVAFSPDGTILATGSGGNAIRLWSVASHRQIGPPLRTGQATSARFSPDGKTLATGSADGTVRLWDVTTHRQIGIPLTGDTGQVLSVAFSPDGKTLATGSADGTVRLWDKTTHLQIGGPLNGHAGAVSSVVFSWDGKTLASSSGHTVSLLNVAYLTDIVPRLCASVGRSLTRVEWAQYVPHDQAYQKVCP